MAGTLDRPTGLEAKNHIFVEEASDYYVIGDGLPQHAQDVDREELGRLTSPMKYSAFSLVRNALSHNRNWKPAWRNPEPKKRYDAIVAGGGGHGLATAYLAKEHGMRNIAVLEKGWIGGGNTGRNTTIVRRTICGPKRRCSTRSR